MSQNGYSSQESGTPKFEKLGDEITWLFSHCRTALRRVRELEESLGRDPYTVLEELTVDRTYWVAMTSHKGEPLIYKFQRAPLDVEKHSTRFTVDIILTCIGDRDTVPEKTTGHKVVNRLKRVLQELRARQRTYETESATIGI
jgi:hypothetical protein